MLFAILLAIQTTTAASPQLSLEKSGEGYVAEIAAPFDHAQFQAVESEVARRAAELCAGNTIDWGKFRFDEELGKNPGTDLAKVKAYRREFRCVAAAQSSFQAVPADWVASAIDEADVRRFFDNYYARRDAGDTDGALAMFRPGTQENAASWAMSVRDSNKQLGAGKRRLVGVTWYVNPEAADRPGIYAALDFVGDYPSMHFYCGYIGLYRKGPGSYEIVREEQNLFERNKETPEAQQLATMRAAMCREN
jgi:hypothetical protein